MFHVGQQVVLVDATETPNWKGTNRPVKGVVYTIRAITDVPWEGLGLLLEEIVNPISPWHGEEFGFRASRFRPVRKTSIDIFTAMLSPAPKERADA